MMSALVSGRTPYAGAVDPSPEVRRLFAVAEPARDRSAGLQTGVRALGLPAHTTEVAGDQSASERTGIMSRSS